MTQVRVPPSLSTFLTLARVLVVATVAATGLAIPPAAASTAAPVVPRDLPTVAAAQSSPDRTAPCRRWQNPNAYGHWHCR